MHVALRRIAPVFVLLLSASVVLGQVATGNYPYGTFDSKGIDAINVGNLNVHLAIPVFQKAGRGLPFSYTLAYDSSAWQIVTAGGQPTWTPVQNWGWLAQTVVPTGYISYSTHAYVCDWPPPKHGSYYIYDTWVYHDPLGVSHAFSGYLEYDPTGCNTAVSSFSSMTSDGSGLTLNALRGGGGPNVTQRITTQNGQSTMAPVGNSAVGSTITDTNGNQISVSSAGVFTDTTGATVMTVAGQAPNPVTLTYPTQTGTAYYTMKYGSYTVQTKFGCSLVTEYSATSVPLVNEIDLPDSSKYTFTYETTPNNPNAVTGRLASVTLPTGGEISYTYTGGSNGIVCSDGTTAGLTRTLANDPAGSTWTYARTPGSGTSHTDVTDGLGNHSKYDFVQAGSTQAQYYETSRSIYQGAATGTPLLARQTCYNNAASPCTTSAISWPITQIDTYETLDGIQTRGATAKYNFYGMETERDDYDFGGATSRGSLLRKEIWAYYGSIPSLPTEDVVYDGSGNLAGETLYAYDTSTPTASSGVPQHISVSGARGNLTLLTQFASSGTSYSSSATYEDTGSLLTWAPPTGTTRLSYDSTFTYVTGTTLPTPSSGVALSNSAIYDTSNTGLLLTSTDPNGAVTSVPSYDSMLRPNEIDFADGGKTTLFYSPTQVGQYTYQTSSVYSDTEVQYDGYGRQSRVAMANGQSGSGWYQEDVCYDANGNTGFSAYPYQGTGFGAGKVCSGSGDSYTYDALGRVKTVSRAGVESRSYTYLGRATQSTDENGVTRISQIDALGRPTIICEISSNSSMPASGSPVSCAADISGTGFITTYSYALATHTTTITQGAQTRTFQTDWLGRTIFVKEPESGQTTYGYAFNSTGLVVTRQRPKANQSNASVLTTTTTQYDSVGRVVSVIYSDGTPTKSFAYDASAGWSDLTQAHLKGRLSLASVSGTGTTSSTIYSYDPLGRTSYLDECLPSGCGTVAYNRQLHYVYDLAGNLTSSTDGAGVTTSYTLSQANEILSLASSLGNTTNPANIVSNVQNGPNGPVNYSLGNGLSGVDTYDSLGRRAGGWICSSSSQPGCSGGTQLYGFTSSWSGVRETGECDTVLNQCVGYGYDEFNRLTSRTVNQGTTQNYTYVYDRYGNRTQQNALQSGLTTSVSFNTATNQISTGGYAYDAAGNMTNDGFHTYTYDAEGNITQVDSGSTAQYVYNALNQRVRTVVGATATEFVFNAAGQRVSVWNGTTHSQLQGQYYWGGKPVAYYANSAAHFQHQDWLGTERMRTTYNGAVEDTFTSLPFGDAQTTTTGTDTDAYHYASLDHDTETNTDHAQFRQYSNTQGRWLSPDPYSGSYDPSNPQSLNRYSYVLNAPVAYSDLWGLDYGFGCGDNCVHVVGTGGGDGGGGDGGGGGGGGGGNSCGFSPESVPVGTSPSTPDTIRARPECSSSGPAGGGGGTANSPSAPSKIAKAICGAIPSGRTTGASGGLGGIGSVGGGLETVVNYSSGQVSGFYYGGVQVGWNGGASGSVYSGYVYGLNGSNSNYSGGFTGFNGGAGPGVFGASSSGGLTGGVGGLGVNPSAPGAVTSGGLSFGGGLLGGFAGGVTATNYSNPIQMGKFWAFDVGDWAMYAAKQVCKAAGF